MKKNDDTKALLENIIDSISGLSSSNEEEDNPRKIFFTEIKEPIQSKKLLFQY